MVLEWEFSPELTRRSQNSLVEIEVWLDEVLWVREPEISMPEWGLIEPFKLAAPLGDLESGRHNVAILVRSPTDKFPPAKAASSFLFES